MSIKENRNLIKIYAFIFINMAQTNLTHDEVFELVQNNDIEALKAAGFEILQRRPPGLIPVQSYDEIWAEHWKAVAEIDKRYRRQKIVLFIVFILMLLAWTVIFVGQ